MHAGVCAAASLDIMGAAQYTLQLPLEYLLDCQSVFLYLPAMVAGTIVAYGEKKITLWNADAAVYSSAAR